LVSRLAFVHTVAFLVDEFRAAMRSDLPRVDSFHVLDESLLQDLLRGRPKPDVYRRVVAQILSATEAGADLVVVTCSSTSPAVDIARMLTSVPIVKIDDPMAERAVAAGPRIGLVCTATSTVEPSTALLQVHAAAQGREITVVNTILPDAFSALAGGDRSGHDDIVRAAVTRVAAQLDVIVLAQASLAHLRDDLAAALPIPVLASPPILMKELVERCARSAPGGDRDR
jgi:Asp/Glu/hydantoin racemase